MKTKRTISLIATLVFLFSFSTAYAGTSAEKENSYNAAVMQLETYFESISNDAAQLYSVLAAFNELGGYSKSLQFGYYVSLLLKISNNEYDQELENLISILEANEGFANYLTDLRGESSIGTIDELVAYVRAREAEYKGKKDVAEEQYKKCLDFYDASSRYFEIVSSTDKIAYEKALELMNSGDFAGAYYAFLEIERYNDSSDWMVVIENQLGYKPTSQNDNLLPVNGLKASNVSQTEIKLVWRNSSHATAYDVYYKAHEDTSWVFLESTTETSSVISNLVEDASYDFKVIATIGRIMSDEAVLLDFYTRMPEEMDDEKKPGLEKGDVDGDGEISVLDILHLQQYVAGWNITIEIMACDINGDGNVNILDILALQKIVINQR